jgi:hypothetical protein
MTCENVSHSNLREREKDVFVGKQRMIARRDSSNRAIHHALCRFTNLALCDVEVVHESVLLTLRPPSRLPLRRDAVLADTQRQDAGHEPRPRLLVQSQS